MGLMVMPGGVSGLGFYDDRGKSRAGIFITPEGIGGISLLDDKGRERVGIDLKIDGPLITLGDGQGGVIWSAPDKAGAGAPQKSKFAESK